MNSESASQGSESANKPGSFSLKIASDGMAAYMVNLAPPIGAGKPVTLEKVIAELKRNNIKHGIDINKISMLLTQGQTAPNELYSIAKGDPPADGKDCVLKWHIDPEILAESSYIVRKDEPIATYKPGKEGQAGKNIFGEAVDATPGRNCEPDASVGIISKRGENGEIAYRAKWLGVVVHQEEGDNVSISIDHGLLVSEDGMQATMDIYARTSSGAAVLAADIMAVLQAAGIKFGVSTDAINEALAKAKATAKDETNPPLKDVVVAKGLPPQQGHSAKLEIHQTVSSGQISETGRINFHERNYPWNVKAGQKIGHLSPAKLAIDGQSVWGHVIEAEQPELTEVELVGVIEEDDGTLVAEIDGALILDGQSVRVSDILVVDGDIGPKTGNVNSESAVHVKGHVNPSFKLESTKDIIIEQNIEDATVHSDASLVVKGGIRGLHSKVHSGNNAEIGFIESTMLNADGDINVAGSIINSTVVSKGKIVAGNQGKKSAIMGGELTASNSIQALIIGSPNGTKTILNVGISKEVNEERLKLLNQIQEIQGKLAQLEQVAQQHKSNLVSEESELAQRLKAAQKTLTEAADQIQPRLEELKRQINQAKKARVIARKGVHIGVVININEHTYEVKRELGPGAFSVYQNSLIFRPSMKR